jgi:hypothetical protein
MIEANSVYKRKYLEFEEVTQCSNANCNSFLPFSLKFGSGVFALGHPYDENKGFKGWIDEFKIFQFTSDQNQGNDSVSSSIDSFYDEFICNQAFGSLVEVNRFDSETNFSEISNLKKLAVKYGILDTDPKLYKKGGAQVIPPAQIGAFLRTAAQNKANICEQLILESYQTANDLPNQRNRGLICANKVHKNNSHTYAHRCQRKKVLGIAKKDLTAGQPRPDFSDVPFCLSCHNDEQSLESLKVSALEIEPIDREFDSRRQPLDIPRTIKGCIPEQAPFNQIGSSCSNNIFYLDNIFDFNPKVIP